MDVAETLLAVDSARQYGLVTGAPTVDVDRCVDILTRGRARGFEPRPDAIERGVEALLREQKEAHD